MDRKPGIVFPQLDEILYMFDPNKIAPGEFAVDVAGTNDKLVGEALEGPEGMDRKTWKIPPLPLDRLTVSVEGNGPDDAGPSLEGPISLEGERLPADQETEGCRNALTNEDVTNYTAQLWKYAPIPESEPEPFPEYINKTLELPGGHITAARVRGKKHKHEGTNCDDWFEVANYGEITFVAVSDGAGSKPFSRIGARESCKAAVGYLLDTFGRLLASKPELRANLTLSLTDKRCMEACSVFASVVQRSAVKAYEAVDAAFYSRRANPAYTKLLGRDLQFRDLSGTLLLAVMIPVNRASKEHLIISCQIGDGMIALLHSQGKFKTSLKLMGIPDSGDFSGETDFLTSEPMKKIENLQPRTRVSKTVADVVMVMSDGVADDYFPHEPELYRLYLDLIVNGVLDRPFQENITPEILANQIKLLRRVPNPLAYPWVNDQNVRIPIQYTSRILKSTGLTLQELWENPLVLELAKFELEHEADSIIKIPDSSERLKIWLDNYVERGSFDDRTLVIVTM